MIFHGKGDIREFSHGRGLGKKALLTEKIER
jgi:hypothetical protein